MEDCIVREIVVAAPVQRVWEVLTRPEFLPRWFTADTAEIDLRPGGSLVLRWAEHGTGLARVERVEEPTLFSFRWALEPEVEPTPAISPPNRQRAAVTPTDRPRASPSHHAPVPARLGCCPLRHCGEPRSAPVSSPRPPRRAGPP